MRQHRTDLAPLPPAKLMPNGFLQGEGYPGRSGILEYLNPDGTVRKEYRPPEEAFSPETLASMAALPLTNGHPPEGRVTADNVARAQVGMVANPKREGDKLRAMIVITAPDAIADVQAGRRQLSMGYSVDVDPTPGVTPRGERYDAVQRNVIANHVAIVDRGRAGPDCAIRIDGEDVIALDVDPVVAHYNRALAARNVLRLPKYDLAQASAPVTPKRLPTRAQLEAERKAKVAAMCPPRR